MKHWADRMTVFGSPGSLTIGCAIFLACASPLVGEIPRAEGGAVSQDEKRVRARELGITIGQYQPGPLNAITDVDGVKVGQVTLMQGEGTLRPGKGPVRTGVTVVIPRDDVWHKKVPAGAFVLNGTGEMTGLAWVAEAGFLEYPIALTNTLNVPRVANGVMSWMIRRYPGIGITDDTLDPGGRRMRRQPLERYSRAARFGRSGRRRTRGGRRWSGPWKGPSVPARAWCHLDSREGSVRLLVGCLKSRAAIRWEYSLTPIMAGKRSCCQWYAGRSTVMKSLACQRPRLPDRAKARLSSSLPLMRRSMRGSSIVSPSEPHSGWPGPDLPHAMEAATSCSPSPPANVIPHYPEQTDVIL